MGTPTVGLILDLQTKISAAGGRDIPAEFINTRLVQILESAQDDAHLLRTAEAMLKPGQPETPDPYIKLADVLDRAFEQASGGKGKDRHAKSDGQKFEDQPICALQRIYGNGYAFGQVGKKMEESMRMPKGKAVAELLGGIVYLGAAVIVREEEDA